MNLRSSLSMVVLAIFLGWIPATGQRREAGRAGLTLFADPNFRGRSVTLRQDTPNLVSMGFNDAASSLRVAPGQRWQVCEDINYRGRCVIVSGEERDLRRTGWNDIISSARRVRGGLAVAPPVGPPGLGGRGRGPFAVLFDSRNYRGRSFRVDGETPVMRGFANRAQSIQVTSGSWPLCDRARFGGRCQVVSGSLPDLSAIGMRRRVASVRPVSVRR